MKKTFWIILSLALLFSFIVKADFSFAQEEQFNVYFFYGYSCPHCVTEQKFLDKIEEKYSEIKVNRYPINDPENIELLKKLCKQCNVEKYIGLVPITFVGERAFIGFDAAEGIGVKIENSIKEYLESQKPPEEPPESGNKVNLPFLGEVDFSDFSLPALAVILGFLDGFNICSLGAIVLILSLVIGFRSRKKILLFGGLFIFTTAITYGFLMTMWSLFFSLLGVYMRNMQILVSGLAIAGGIYFFWQYLKFRKRGPVCEIETGKGIKSKWMEKIQESFKNPKNILSVTGIVFVFAFLVAVIEFPCSAAVPVIFTGILAQAQLSGFLHFLYIVLFVVFYMVNEIVVFLIALFTMRLWLASGKFVTYATLAQAIILFLLGAYYLFGI